MGTILCATRGGVDSRETLEVAIAMAREQGDDLVLLYVADASFLDRIAAAVVVDVEAELERLGRFQLAMAGEQAALQGVEPRLLVRRGNLEKELVAVARELDASLILLGCPREGTAIFDEPGLRSLASRLRARTGAEVRLIGEDRACQPNSPGRSRS